MPKVFLLFILIWVFLISPAEISAACQGLPEVSFTVSPTSGEETSVFTVTLDWDLMSASDFARYNNPSNPIDIYIRSFEDNDRGKYIPTNNGQDVVDRAGGRTQTKRPYTLTDFPIDNGDHQLYIYLTNNINDIAGCNFATAPKTITVTSKATGPNKQPGHICDPRRQTTSEPRQTCATGNICAKQCDNTYKCAVNDEDCGPSALTKELRKVLVSKTCYDPSSTTPIDKTTQQYCSSAAGTLCPINDAQRTNTSNSSGPNKWTGITSALGCVPTDPKQLIPAILKLATGAAGGIAFLLMIMGAFQMITSAGNPDALKAGQGRFTAAIIGLLFVIFSVLLLQIIGVDILDIPGFG